MALTYYDYIVLAIFAISIIFGIYKGFISSAGSILVSVVSWVCAAAFTDDLVYYIQQKTDFLEQIIYYVQADEKIADLTLRKASIDVLSSETIEEAVNTASMPDFFKANILTNIQNKVFTAVDSLGDYFDYTVGSMILNVICFIAILAATALVVTLIKSALEAMVKLPALRYFDGLLGAGFGLLRGLFWVYVFFLILPSILLVLPSGIVAKYLGDVADAPIASIFYETNILATYIGGFIKLA